MRAVIQRVADARVAVEDKTAGKIGPGLCVFLGIGREDDPDKANYLGDRVAALRIFADERGKMNRSVTDIQGEVLVVSQFTLYADCARGNRPSFSGAAASADAEKLYHCFVERLRTSGLIVATGEFGAKMSVSLTNDGPVTLVLET